MNGRKQWVLALACISIVMCGCMGKNESKQSAKKETLRASSEPKLDVAQIQRSTMSFAGRYATAMADVYDQVREHATNREARIMALRLKMLAASGAQNNAVNANPLVGLMDMALMVTLTRQIAQDPWPKEIFGEADAAKIVRVLEAQEADIFTVVAAHLSTAQIEELRALAKRWREKNPNQRYIAAARLADFQEAAKSNGAVAQLANSVFGLMRLDLFSGLDPAVRSIEESRLLAERMFFYAQGMGFMMSWQGEMLSAQILSEPQMTQMFTDTTTVAGSTTRFTDATRDFSAACSRFAKTIEDFRKQLPDQQAKLVTDLDALVARQRDGALQQATTQISVQRDAAIKQLDATVGAQQATLTRNLQGVTDQSIDRLFARARSLVLLAVGAILAAFILYRLFAAAHSRPRPS